MGSLFFMVFRRKEAGGKRHSFSEEDRMIMQFCKMNYELECGIIVRGRRWRENG